ncbi:hypothetical protein BC835DRAFT_44531 [Cytidiella melzeri]|nr:hypothetical protein BC835DRAFT_44531 [Cytidiella melzeri]
MPVRPDRSPVYRVAHCRHLSLTTNFHLCLRDLVESASQSLEIRVQRHVSISAEVNLTRPAQIPTAPTPAFSQGLGTGKCGSRFQLLLPDSVALPSPNRSRGSLTGIGLASRRIPPRGVLGDTVTQKLDTSVPPDVDWKLIVPSEPRPRCMDSPFLNSIRSQHPQASAPLTLNWRLKNNFAAIAALIKMFRPCLPLNYDI